VTTAQNWSESGLLDSWKTEGGHRRITRASVDRLIGAPRKQRAADGANRSNLQDAQRLHILIVEADKSQQHLYQMRLANWSMTPLSEMATDGFDALVRIGSRCPDLLITDLDMPHIDGFYMLNALAAMPACAQLSIVVISGEWEAAALSGKLPERCQLLGKPAPFHELEKIAEELAEQKKIRGQGKIPSKNTLPLIAEA
jgi:CheY-like chemotaxis protein